MFGLFAFRFISCSFHCFTSCQRFETGVECITSRNLRFESINGTYERAVLRRLRALMVSINVASFKLVEKPCAFTAAFSVTRKAEDFNSKTCLACNIAPFYLVEKAWVCFALQPVFRVLGQREIRRVAVLWVEILNCQYEFGWKVDLVPSAARLPRYQIGQHSFRGSGVPEDEEQKSLQTHLPKR